ncbi:MAG: hypothetical protein LBD29_05045 [Treponema sp.]|jgi:hypothetical protein|nr:hypothetical protein [Treponema sp.]
MRYSIAILLLAANAATGYALNNRLYLDGLWGVSYVAKEDKYYTYHGGNLGWHGLISNNREDHWGSGFGSYNLGFLVEAGFYQYYGKDTEFWSLKFSPGISIGQYFVFYVKPNLHFHKVEALGISATGGMKIHLFMKDLALAYGIGVDFIPIIYFYGKASQYPLAAAGIHLTVDIVYEINRTKRKNP